MPRASKTNLALLSSVRLIEADSLEAVTGMVGLAYRSAYGTGAPGVAFFVPWILDGDEVGSRLEVSLRSEPF